MSSFLSIIIIFLIMCHPILSVRISSYILPKTRYLVVDNSTGVVMKCSGSHCFDKRTSLPPRRIFVIYLHFVHYIYEVHMRGLEDRRRTVKAQWIQSTKSCVVSRFSLNAFACRDLSNGLTITNNKKLTDLFFFGYAPFYENYIGCYKMNLTRISKTNVTNIEECVYYCSGSQWFGLSATHEIIYCMCFQTLGFGTASVDISHCNCRGGDHYYIICGGSDGYVSVYYKSEEPMWQKGIMTDRCMYSLTQCINCEIGRLGYHCQYPTCQNPTVPGNVCGDLNCFNVFKRHGYQSFDGCACPYGYYMTENFTCMESDECQMDPCSISNRRCINTPGSYECECLDGYREFNDTFCEDIDECVVKEEFCRSFNSTCLNTPGSFRCLCSPGYELKDISCVDIDECLNDSCVQWNAACTNTIGSFTCYCPTGFIEGERRICFDIDECHNVTACDTNTTVCRNIPGDFRCYCRPGYSKILPATDKGPCEDEDECITTTDVCGVGVTCTNVHGSFTCSCSTGTILVVYEYASECKDIDECSTNVCNSSISYCVNVPGTFVCVCKPGIINDDPFVCDRDFAWNITTENPEKLSGKLELLYMFLYVLIPLIGLVIIVLIYRAYRAAKERSMNRSTASQ